ncbi:MAG TPA: DUF732 domain-containing protein [Mycobacterium sp.]|jgi:hypothetical protein
MIRNLLTCGVLAVAAIGFATPANADQYDFISRIENAGVSYTSITGMLSLGRAVCHDLRIGNSPGWIAVNIEGNGWAPYEAGTIMGAAADTMCPDTWPTLLAWARSQRSPAPSVSETVGEY